MVPKGWVDDNICTVLDRIIDYRGQSVPKSDTGIKLITAKNVRFGFLDLTEQEYISDDSYVDWMKRGIPQSGDILFTTEAPLGNACRFPSGDIFAVGQRTITLRTNQKLDSEYLLYYLLSDKGQRHIDFRSSGSTAKGIKASEFKKLHITYPQLISEQRKIAQILLTWDKAIATTERLLANKQQQKQALMQRLLTGKQRFAGFEGEWIDVLLGDIATLTAGGTPSTSNPEFWGGDIPWMSSGEIHHKQVYSVAGRITHEGLSSSSTKILPLNCLLIALAGQGKTRGTVALNKVELCTNQSIAAAIFNKQPVIPEFIFHNMDNRYDELRSLSTGDGGRGGLNLSILRNVKIQLPSIEEQKKIALTLSLADTEIITIQKQIDNLKQQKKALMQQLLTGKRRVKVDEVAA